MSGIHIGSSEASAIKIGGANASAVYAGANQVWPMKTPPVSDYPATAKVNYKRHGHSYGYRDIPWDRVDAAARHRHKITANVTSGYSCVSADGNQIPMTQQTVYLVEYELRARAYQQGDTSFVSEVGFVSSRMGTPASGIQSGWGGQPSSAPNLFSGKERILRWTSSTTSGGAREFDGSDGVPVDVPADQMDLAPELRGYRIYSKFRTLVRKTGPGNFGLNEETIWDSWTTTVPGTTGDHTTWRSASGAFYLTSTASATEGMQAAAKSSVGTSMNGSTGMDIIYDKLTFTPVTEADHI